MDGDARNKPATGTEPERAERADRAFSPRCFRKIEKITIPVAKKFAKLRKETGRLITKIARLRAFHAEMHRKGRFIGVSFPQLQTGTEAAYIQATPEDRENATQGEGQ